MWWRPHSCTLQLNFGSSPVVRVGDAYTGTSVITYRREESRHEVGYAFTTAADNAPASQGLHFHAVTRCATGAWGTPAGMRPLTVTEYHLSRVRPSAPMKVTAVEELDRASSTSAATTATESRGGGKGGKGKESGGKGSKKTNAASSPAPAAATSSQELDIGSKLVLFDGVGDDTAFPVGSEVELTVHFTGFLQDGQQGGIYLPTDRASHGGSGQTDTSSLPLLTHFEVSLARWAFPCPDDPHYRVDWTIAALTLPSRYGTIFTNGTEVSRREVRGKDGSSVNVGFSTAGPMPAYVLAFIAYPDADDGAALLTVERDIPASSFETFVADGGDAVAQASGTDSGEVVRACVVTDKDSGVSNETLLTVLDQFCESVQHFTEFFHCPIPMCGSSELRLLLVPTMPYISGMEHHCCIFLNESIFRDSTGKGSSGGSGDEAVVRAELIAHEVAHHWVGNRVGFSFSVKEGICQVLEQQGADLLLGRPPRKLVALQGGGTGTTNTTTGSGSQSNSNKASGKNPGGKSSKGGRSGADAAVTETTKGKEFTGQSYQRALAEVQNRVVERGVPAFRDCMRGIMQRFVVQATLEEEEFGGREAMRLTGMAESTPAPCFTTDDFIVELFPSTSA